MIQLSIAGIRFAIIALVPYWVLLFIGTHIPTTAMPAIDDIDKYLHATAYAGLSFLIVWAAPFRARWASGRYIIAATLAAAYGIFDEISQLPVGRNADVMDWVFDCVGICVGISIFFVSRKLWLLWNSVDANANSLSL